MDDKTIKVRVELLKELSEYASMSGIAVGYGTTVEEVLRGTRQKNIVKARRAQAYYLKSKFQWSDTRIAEFFGLKSESSAWYLVRAYKDDAGIL